MRYLQFKQHFQNHLVIRLTEIRQLETDFDLRRIVEWQEKGYLLQLKRGHYLLSENAEDLTEEELFVVANQLYSPSYVSLESALNYYNLIPEMSFSITSVSSRKTQEFSTPIGRFSYRSLKPELMFGYKLINLDRDRFLQQAKLAQPEKAVLDWLYLKQNLKSQADVSSLRFNKQELNQVWNQARFDKFVSRFDSAKVKRQADIFKQWLQH